MHERRFQRLLLTLPIVLPICFIPINPLIMQVGPPWPVEAVFGVFAISPVYGAIPYAVVVLAVLKWARTRPTRELWRIAPLMPLMMIVVFTFLYLVFVFSFRQLRFPSGSLDGFWVYPLCILGLGYFYVGLGFLLKKALESKGTLVPDHASFPK